MIKVKLTWSNFYWIKTNYGKTIIGTTIIGPIKVSNGPLIYIYFTRNYKKKSLVYATRHIILSTRSLYCSYYNTKECWSIFARKSKWRFLFRNRFLTVEISSSIVSSKYFSSSTRLLSSHPNELIFNFLVTLFTLSSTKPVGLDWKISSNRFSSCKLHKPFSWSHKLSNVGHYDSRKEQKPFKCKCWYINWILIVKHC